MVVISHIYSKLDKNRTVIGLFLDIKKAFYSVDHSILLSKIKKYGIRGNANNLINTFLENRIQQVRLSDSLSDYIILNNGILQGNEY